MSGLGEKSMKEEDKEKINDIVDGKREEIIEFLQKMIRVPTGPPPTSEKLCQQLVEKKLDSIGLELDVFEITEMLDMLIRSPNFGKIPEPEKWYEGRPIVVGKMRGTGGGRSIILNGHVDTVGVEPRKLWKHKPFGAELDNGRIYGRGASDMKGGVAAMISAVESVVEAGFRPKGDITLESVIDEEGGANGTRACILRGYNADAGVVTEPTQLQIFPAQQGWLMLRVKVYGKPAHVGIAYEGINALEKGLKIYQALKDLESARNAHKRHPLYTGKYPIATPICVGVVRAGEWVNYIPGECVLEACILTLPNENIEEVRGEIETYLKGVAYSDLWLKDNPPEIEWWGSVGIGVDVGVEHPLVRVLTNNVKYVTHRNPEISGMIAGCDMNQLTIEGKTPTIIFGPGNLRLAHAFDEFVEVDEVINCTKALAMSILEWCDYR